MPNMKHPHGRRYRSICGAGTVSTETAITMAGVENESQLSELVAAGEINPPLESSFGPMFVAADLTAYAARARKSKRS